MSAHKPLSIATINFKGGVGKTTVTWCLGVVLQEYRNTYTLMFDLDAQMSLTETIDLNQRKSEYGIILEDGRLKYIDPYIVNRARAIKEQNTLYHALKQYSIGSNQGILDLLNYGVFRIQKRLYFVPSTEELYWAEFEIGQRHKGFISDLMDELSHHPSMPKFGVALFDCPPSFSVLSYSVLLYCDIILVPVNPDMFASRGVGIFLSALKRRIAPDPLPKVVVFMNKTKTYDSMPTSESRAYMRDGDRLCRRLREEESIDVWFLSHAYIPDRAAIKRSLPSGSFPKELEQPFIRLWNSLLEIANG
ncbi:MAG: hypothetical protein KatS3mg060_2034 [Dehalococcoidia bacterium]|nr:MAG: hypothetical protein KatS3mg060_2034 [Dehalococcoidia bacterium]